MCEEEISIELEVFNEFFFTHCQLLENPQLLKEYFHTSFSQDGVDAEIFSEFSKILIYS